MIRRTLALVRPAFSRHTTVAAYLALLLASSSATYAATTIGSAEVINNSLQSVDLKDGAAVGGVDVINDSIKGVDIQESTLNGVSRAIVYREIPDTASGPMKKVASAGGYDLLVDCWRPYDNLLMWIWVKGPAGVSQFHILLWPNDDARSMESAPGGAVLPAASATLVSSTIAAADNYTRLVGDFTVASGANLVKFNLHMLIDNRSSTRSCSIWGTALKAA